VSGPFEAPGPDKESGQGPGRRLAFERPAPARESPLWRRSPLFAAAALAACAWLLWGFAPDVAYFFSPRDPIDLGGPGGYRLEAAQANRLVRVAGAPAARVGISDARGKDERTVIGLRGVNLAVDCPGRPGSLVVYEGRLLPRAEAAYYGEAVAALRSRGWEVGERWLVVRDGERPRARYTAPALALLALAIAAINARALWKRIFS
jgi:hypothetical protein